MMLLNVIYISDFVINIVADNIFKNKEFHFNTQHRYFYRNNSAVFLIFKIKPHYILKNNRISERMIAFTTFIRTDFLHD